MPARIELTEDEIRAVLHAAGFFLNGWELYQPSEDTQKVCDDLKKVKQKIIEGRFKDEK